MSVLRPLPARPSLEYARKEAKALLRRLRAGDPDALDRFREYHPLLAPHDARLADTQLVVAREHGFASWPKLVRYMDDVERQQQAHVQVHHDQSYFEGYVQHLLAQHRERGRAAGRTLAAYVPRFYGLSVDDVFAHVVHEDEARLAAARAHGAPSWEVLLDRGGHDARTRTPPWDIDPMRLAANAMETGDVRALEQVVEAHPELLNPSEHDISLGRTLMGTALVVVQRVGAATMQPIIDWLASHGFYSQRELDMRLCGHVGMTVDEVNDLLERGANPRATAPNGIPVLDHAIVRYWNGDAVDIIAAPTTPRDAFWIAAGLGNVEGVHRFFDRNGKLTRAAYRDRPDFVAVGARGFMPQLPDADDEEVLVEALLIATLNQRTTVIEYLTSRGAPVNSLVFGTSLITIAAGNAMTTAAECLVRCGADIDLRGWGTKQSAREMASELFLQRQTDDRRRILEIFGMDSAALLAERAVEPPSAPVIVRNLRRALMFAAADAVRVGHAVITRESLLFGLLRNERQVQNIVKSQRGMEAARFRADFAHRLETRERSPDEPELPLDAEAKDALDAAIAHASAYRREAVGELELFHALLRDEIGPASTLLARYGVEITKLTSWLDDELGRMGPARVFRKAKA